MEESQVENKMEEKIEDNKEKKVDSSQNEDEGEVQISESKASGKSSPEDVGNNKINTKMKEVNVETKRSSRDKENLYEEIDIPEKINASVEDDVLIMKKDDKEIRRKLVALIDVKVEDGRIVISAKRNRKIEKKLFGTYKAHVNNMIKGLTEGFEYKLKIANVHFPMNVSYDNNKNELIVKNFLGEKKDRTIKLVEGVDVKVDNDEILISGHDIEKAGEVATKIEKGAKVRNKDRRIFQDGIFLISKPGKEFL